MKGKIFLVLFGLPFAGVGVWAGWTIAFTLQDGWRMQTWQPVDARVVEGGYRTHSGDDSTTYEAYATYRYRIEGVDYSNDRVGISGGADNIGDYQQSTGRRLADAATSGEPVIVYYDPAAPSDSVIDRDIRWGMVGFKSIFLLLFGGVGSGLIVLAIRAPRAKDPDDAAYVSAPWLLNEHWQTPVIRSGSRGAMIGAWIFAAIWNLISMPLPFLLVGEVTEKQNYPALLGLLFPLVGLWLIIRAIRRTREWRRFGAAPVTLDPFPGAIGGHVGGTIDLAVPYTGATRYEVSLTCIRSSVSGSGKNRSRSERALWQDDRLAAAEAGPSGTRLTFRFDVPEGLRQSDAVSSGRTNHEWRLNLVAEMPGTDLDRVYEIPVYPTGARSNSLPESKLRSAREREDVADEAKVRERLNLGYGAGGRQMHFPAGRSKGVAATGFLVGVVFAGIGWFLLTSENETFMGVIFGGIGSLVALGMLYTGLNSLTVTQQGGSIVAVRRILGVPVSRKSMHRDSVESLTRKSSLQVQSGGRHRVYYSIRARDRRGHIMTIAEGLDGDGEASAAIRLIRRAFGLAAPRPGSSEPSPQMPDILASDS